MGSKASHFEIRSLRKKDFRFLTRTQNDAGSICSHEEGTLLRVDMTDNSVDIENARVRETRRRYRVPLAFVHMHEGWSEQSFDKYQAKTRRPDLRHISSHCARSRCCFSNSVKFHLSSWQNEIHRPEPYQVNLIFGTEVVSFRDCLELDGRKI